MSADWIDIQDAAIAANAPVSAQLIRAYRDNIESLRIKNFSLMNRTSGTVANNVVDWNEVSGCSFDLLAHQPGVGENGCRVSCRVWVDEDAFANGSTQAFRIQVNSQDGAVTTESIGGTPEEQYLTCVADVTASSGTVYEVKLYHRGTVTGGPYINSAGFIAGPGHFIAPLPFGGY